ncbi:hypothetical protein XGA_2681 [Xanthomonas hortorum ATCC 19865]|nr:hypothetical protein XGA_2681 [Xanthomonas hortorum ATCC 19865]
MRVFQHDARPPAIATLSIRACESDIAQLDGAGIEAEIFCTQIAALQTQIRIHIATQCQAGKLQPRRTCTDTQAALADTPTGFDLQIATEHTVAAIETQLLLRQIAVVGTQIRHARIGEHKMRACDIAQRRQIACIGTRLQIQTQIAALHERARRRIAVRNRKLLHLQYKGRQQLSVGIGVHTQIGTGLPIDRMPHHADMRTHMRHLQTTAGAELAALDPQIGIHQAVALQRQPVHIRKQRRNPAQRCQFPVQPRMPGGTRQQAAHGLQRQLPALHAQIRIQRQPGIGRLGHAHLQAHVLIDLQLRGQFAKQGSRHTRAVVQRRAPLQLAAGLQRATRPAQLAIYAAFAGARGDRVAALRIACHIQCGSVTMYRHQRVGELQQRKPTRLLGRMPRDAGFDAQLAVAQHFAVIPAHPCVVEGRTRGKQFHRTAAQLFEHAQLQLAIAFDVQLAQRHCLHVVGDDAVELQGPGRSSRQGAGRGFRDLDDLDDLGGLRCAGARASHLRGRLRAG